jgi:glycosyltransferase 2 family protein
LAASRRSLFIAAQAVLAAVVLYFAADTLRDYWNEVARTGPRLRPRWGLLALSSVLVLLAYAVLVETWRRVLGAWDRTLPWGESARIWFVSNLGRYVPGKLWQIGAMGVMAQRQGISPIAATGSAIVINLVNLLVGFGVVLLLGAEVFENTVAAVLAVVATAAAVVAAPLVLPWLARTLGRVMGKSLAIPRLPIAAIWLAAIGSLLAWLLYGTAFHVFVAGTIGSAPGRTVSYIAAYTASYLIGYVMLFAPGGIVFREAALATFLTRLGLMTAADATVIAVASRLWLTVLEVVPGALYLARDAIRAPLTKKTPH